jgi:hypothetical protein
MRRYTRLIAFLNMFAGKRIPMANVFKDRTLHTSAKITPIST